MGISGGKNYQINVFGNKVTLKYFGLLSKEDARQLYADLKARYPKYDKWYVLADRREAKALKPEAAEIIQQSIEDATKNGMKFCVQLVDSATVKVQILRLAKEKKLKELFFPVTTDDEAKTVILDQKKKHGMTL